MRSCLSLTLPGGQEAQQISFLLLDLGYLPLQADEADSRRLVLVDDQFFRHAVHIVAKRWATARVLRLQSVLLHPFADFTRKIDAVIFRHRFESGL